MRTERFHARVARLDKAWRERFEMHPSAIHRLRDRLGREIGAA
jgi:regulator of CtrA degradation